MAQIPMKFVRTLSMDTRDIYTMNKGVEVALDDS